MFKVAAFLTAIIYLTACASKDPEFDSTIVPAKSDNAKAIVTDSLLPGANIPPTIVQPVSPTGTTTKSQTTSAGLNPAHGQPGHDCKLAVGAPLNSKPIPAPTVTNTTSKTNPTLVTTPPVITPQVSTTPQLGTPQLGTTPQVTTTPQPVMNSKGQRLNPEHGQPGHDCKIAVGQPLKS